MNAETWREAWARVEEWRAWGTSTPMLGVQGRFVHEYSACVLLTGCRVLRMHAVHASVWPPHGERQLGRAVWRSATMHAVRACVLPPIASVWGAGG